MYECIVGYAPFYAEDSVSTCKRIVHWRTNLSFPPEVRLSANFSGQKFGHWSFLN